MWQDVSGLILLSGSQILIHVHSQYGDLPRAVPRLGSLLLLQHNPQYVLMKPFQMCSLADFACAVLGFLLMLLVLAVRHHRLGYKQVWTSSVAAYPWFATKSGGGQKQKTLPAPVTARRSRSQSQRPRNTRAATAPATMTQNRTAQAAPVTQNRTTQAAPVVGPAVPEKRPSQHRRPTMPRHEPTRNEVPTYVYWMPHKQPDEAHVRDERSRDKYRRNASPRR